MNPFPRKRGAKNSEKSKRNKDGDPQEDAVASSTLSATSSRSIAGTSTAPLAWTASRKARMMMREHKPFPLVLARCFQKVKGPMTHAQT
jgi:hypothetical protein